MSSRIPLQFHEVLFELNGGLSVAQVMKDIQQRKLAHPLSSADAAALQAHGISAAQIEILKKNVVSAETGKLADAQVAARKKAQAASSAKEAQQEIEDQQIRQQQIFSSQQAAAKAAATANGIAEGDDADGTQTDYNLSTGRIISSPESRAQAAHGNSQQP